MKRKTILIGLFMSIFGIACGPSVPSDDGDAAREVNRGNKYYKKIYKDIDGIRANGWESSRYYRIQNAIKDYTSKDLFDKEAADELQELLEASYILSLKDTVEQYCVLAKSLNNYKEIDKEIRALKRKRPADVQSISSNLNSFVGAASLAAKAEYYAKQEALEGSRTARYQQQIEAYKKHPLLKQNSWLQGRLVAAVQAMSTQQSADSYYKRFRSGSRSFDSGDCNIYLPASDNRYYYNACMDSLQAPLSGNAANQQDSVLAN